jgi:murein DD-endopeptidase MepM/ murein hydrolase activator NlpD
MVSPPKSVINRIKREYKEAMKIYSTFTTKKLFKHSFSLPLNSKITSDFGTKRIFNNKVKSYHTGIDFKAKMNTKIPAINDGKVVLAKNRYFAGNSVIISHGRGIYSCYYHLNKIKVKKNEFVKKGQIIGLSGMSGRVTGPHLHFTTWLNGVIVNPKVLIELLNQI